MEETRVVSLFEVVFGAVDLVAFWLAFIFCPVLDSGDDGLVVAGASVQAVSGVVEVEVSAGY